jgi:Pentapeptide repeats (8 copies)
MKLQLPCHPANARNFVGQNLKGRSFRGQDLTGADFSGANCLEEKWLMIGILLDLIHTWAS